METTSERLKSAVERAGISQKDLASALGLSEAEVSRILSGARRLRIETAEAVLAHLREVTGRTRGLTLNDLMRGAA